ncbi:MAG: (Fe-S)-binding protein [Gammaproteobacteria bacterium]|nr:MAG: (Fe-S)-binding protein [Gammaproteobacteria bacterium]
MRYSTILDSARAQLRKADRGVAVTAPDSPLMTVAAHLARALHLPGLRGRLARALPIEDKAPAPGTYPPANPPRGPIGLLLGCVTRTQQPGALLAAIRLLNALDYEVVVPAAQECCGALAAHQGDLATAQRQIEANRSAFAGLDGMVSLASGCSLHLAEHLPERSPEDIVTFLTRRLRTRPLPFDRPDGPIALHIPCTLANGLKAPNSLLELLGNLSDTELHTLGQTGGCCGAAGTHLLTQREQAERLREPFLEQLKALKPRYLLTANIGCAMHLAEGAMSEGIGLEVLHPVELLARLLNESRDLGK